MFSSIRFPVIVVLLLFAAGILLSHSAHAIGREDIKCLALTPYYPGSGISFSPRVADDIAYLNPDMLRVEFVKDGDGSVNYCAYDYVVDQAGDRGVGILGLIDYATVTWAGRTEWETPAFRAQFVNRAVELVTHFKDRANPIHHWEIWNEEDIELPEFDVRIEPPFYALLLIQTYDAIKAVDPGATVILGGISPKGFEYTENYLNDLYNTTEMQNYYSTNGYYPFDAVACHPYPEIFGNPDPPGSATGLDDVLNDRIKAVMNTHGDRLKKVWLTEMGWSSYFVTEAQQASYLTSSFNMVDALVDPAYPGDPPYVEKYFWFQYTDFGGPNLWGLRTEDRSREKPSYAAYLALTTPGPTPPPIVVEPGENPPVSGSSDAVLPHQVSGSDLIEGMSAAVITGGFHPASTGTVASLTNGQFDASGTTLVLMDYPHPDPALRVRYTFPEAMDITEVRMFAGHVGDIGNRAFQSNDIYINGALAASELNTGNYEQVPPNSDAVSLVSWLPVAGETYCATNVTTIDVAFYPVAGIGEGFRDRWGPCTDPAEDTDGAGAAYVSPIIKEIDVFGTIHVTPKVTSWETY